MATQEDLPTLARAARLLFTGERIASSTHVTVSLGGGPSRNLPLHLEIGLHSPTGFEWGYQGSGPGHFSLLNGHGHEPSRLGRPMRCRPPA